MTARFVLATANPDKATEVRQILLDTLGDVELVPRPDDVPEVVEDGDTLEANARLKAVALVAATGEACIADDTGLEVDALGGAPGVYSARYAGEHASYADNFSKLLVELADVDEADRTARFRTVALARFPDGSEVVASGAVEGHIATQPRGRSGFGYDPSSCRKAVTAGPLPRWPRPRSTPSPTAVVPFVRSRRPCRPALPPERRRYQPLKSTGQDLEDLA